MVLQRTGKWVTTLKGGGGYGGALSMKDCWIKTFESRVALLSVYIIGKPQPERKVKWRVINAESFLV